LVSRTLLKAADAGIMMLAGAIFGDGEKLEELFDPPLPGSVQLRLQHRRAIEASPVLLAD
jgi:hypothetical protein